MKIIDVTKENYDSIINENSGVVVLDFWAKWCAPCKSLAVILADICENMDITIAKVNTEDELDLTVKFSITSIPTLIIMKNGIPTDKIIGLKEKSFIEDIIKKAL